MADLGLMLWSFSRHFDPALGNLQLVERIDWLPAMGLQWSLAADGISAPLVLLSGLVTLLTVAASWDVERKPRLYFALLLAQASAQAVVFLSQDFLLFFLAWELELVPVYLLIAIWGGQRRQYAATKFILYTATASLLILISGAGPSLLALCPPEKGRAVAEAMEKRWEQEGVHTRALPLKLQSGGSR